MTLEINNAQKAILQRLLFKEMEQAEKQWHKCLERELTAIADGADERSRLLLQQLEGNWRDVALNVSVIISLLEQENVGA